MENIKQSMVLPSSGSAEKDIEYYKSRISYSLTRHRTWGAIN